MYIETVVNEVIDGAITSITLKIHNDNIILQETLIDLPLYENCAIIKSNKSFIDDELLIAECFSVMKKELVNKGVKKISISDSDGSQLIFPMVD